MTVVRSVFQGRTWQHAALRLVPLHRVRWFTTDSLGLCSAVFSFLPRWVLGLELLKKYYALLTKYSDSRLQLKKCATVLNTMKAGRQVRVGGICSSPLPFDLNQHWLSGMMFIADFKTNFQFKKMTQGRGKVCKTDGEIYWKAFMRVSPKKHVADKWIVCFNGFAPRRAGKSMHGTFSLTSGLSCTVWWRLCRWTTWFRAWIIKVYRAFPHI